MEIWIRNDCETTEVDEEGGALRLGACVKVEGSRLDDGTVGELNFMMRHIRHFDAKQDSVAQRLGDDVVESPGGERVVAAFEGASSARKTDLVLLP
mgnify:CR=1 FL=1